MSTSPRAIQRTYLLLLTLTTLSASFIWGINTLFLLDGGLNNTEAFAANAFFTAGQMVFEVPTGVVADTRGRRTSFLLGTLTLSTSTVLYLWMWHSHAPFWAWAIVSALLGLGFSFFSGAFEAWLVDALTATGFKGRIETVFAKGEIAEGGAMLGGAVAGGFVAQATSLGGPYVIRAVLLVVTFVLACVLMRDVGFTPVRGKGPIREMKDVLRSSVRYGLGNRPVRWIVLAAPFTTGVSFYAFYAMQPYLLQLYGNQRAYGVAGLAAGIFAGAQMAGGFLSPQLGRIFRRRTDVLLVAMLASGVALALISFAQSLWTLVPLVVAWGLLFAAAEPVRQAYLNGLIASKQRATVLSFDSLVGSAGAVGVQPALGRVADLWGYPASYACAAVLQVLAAPFVWLARRERAAPDTIPRHGTGLAEG